MCNFKQNWHIFCYTRFLNIGFIHKSHDVLNLVFQRISINLCSLLSSIVYWSTYDLYMMSMSKKISRTTISYPCFSLFIEDKWVFLNATSPFWHFDSFAGWLLVFYWDTGFIFIHLMRIFAWLIIRSNFLKANSFLMSSWN